MYCLKARYLALILSTILLILFTALLLISMISPLIYLGLFLITVATGFGIFFSDRLVELNLKEGKLLLSEAKATNEATKALAVSTLELIDASRHGQVLYNHDKDAYEEARANLERLCDRK